MKTFYKLTFLAAIVSGTGYAERFDITADIGQIRYHEGSTILAPQWKKSIWFGLKSPDKTPNCKIYGGQYAISVPPENESAISLILAAKMSSSKVLITLDDTIKYPEGSNYCKLQYVTIK